MEKSARGADEQCGHGPEDCAGGDDARAVAARRGARRERVADGLHERAAQREGAQRGGGHAQRLADLLVHRGKQLLIRALQQRRRGHQSQRPSPPLRRAAPHFLHKTLGVPTYANGKPRRGFIVYIV